MRIFIGLTDVANITANYTKGFTTLGHQVFSVVWNKSVFYQDAKYNLVIDTRKQKDKFTNHPFEYIKIALRMMQLIKALNCDLFILYAPAVLPTHIIYPLLKFLGKKIITAFWGSDIRYWYTFAEEMKTFGVENEVSPFFNYAKNRSGGSYWDKKHTIKVAEKYSDLILSQPDCGQLQSRPYMRANVPIDLSEYRFNVPGRVKPLVLHAPSVPEAKGTDIVLKAIEELKGEGIQFDFQLIEKMPNRELRELLAESDIVVDELYSATIGGLSAEAMATGNAVLVRYMEDYSKVPPGCPAINVNKYTLKEKLREIILDLDRRKALAERGRPYVESANDNIKICENLLQWLEHRKSMTYAFYPAFYKQCNIPPELLREEKKDTTRRRLDFFKGLLSTGTTKRR